MDCVLKRKDGVWGGTTITLNTYGPGLQWSGIEGIIVTCSLVSQKRLDKVIKKKGQWSAVGVGASAGFIVGGRAGLAINHRGAACFVTGLAALNFGASAGAIHLSIDESPLDNEVIFQKD